MFNLEYLYMIQKTTFDLACMLFFIILIMVLVLSEDDNSIIERE